MISLDRKGSLETEVLMALEEGATMEDILWVVAGAAENILAAAAEESLSEAPEPTLEKDDSQ